LETKIETIDNQTNFAKEIRLWHILVGVGLLVFGALFHFMFEWLGSWKPIGWFFPVNESVWEHTKLTFWVGIILYGIEYGFLRKKVNNFFFGKAIAFYTSLIIIIFGHYGIVESFGLHAYPTVELIIDIILFAASIAIQQALSIWILTKEPIAENKPLALMIPSIVMIGILAILMIVFTYATPQIPLFEHMESGQYGILT
jgi:hypothetical protein